MRKKKSRIRLFSIIVLAILVLSSLVLIPRVFAQTSYNISFSQTGSAVQPSVSYSLSNGTIGSKTTPFSINVESGLTLSYTYGQDVKGTTNGVRYAFVSASPSSPQTITGTLPIQATYQTQYQVLLNQTGSAIAPSVSYSLSNGTTDGGLTPFTIWVDAGQSLSYYYNTNPSVATDVSYYLANNTNGNEKSSGYQTINSPVNISMTYEKLIGLSSYGSDPYSSIYDPTNNQIFVTNYEAGSVSVIDGAPGSSTENTVINTITVGSNPTWLAYDSTDNEIFVVNEGSNTTSVIAASSDSVVATIPSYTSGTLTGIAYDPDNDYVYVSSDCGMPAGPGDSCYYPGGVNIINAALNTYVASVNASCGGSNPAVDTKDNIIIVADTCDLYQLSYYDYPGTVTLISGSNISQVFTQALDESTTTSGLPTHSYGGYYAFPLNVIYDPSNDYAYISDPGAPIEYTSYTGAPSGNGEVTALNVADCNLAPPNVPGLSEPCTNPVSGYFATTHIQAGNGSAALTLDTSNGNLYVTNDFSNTTSAINTATISACYNSGTWDCNNAVVATDETGIGGMCGSAFCSSILFDPGNDEVYVPNVHSNYTSVINGNNASSMDNQLLKNVPVLSDPFLGQGAYDSADNDVYVLNPGQQYLGELVSPVTVIYTGPPNSVSFSPNSGGVEDGFSVSSEATVSGPPDNSYLSPNLVSGCVSCNGSPNSAYFSLDWGSNPVLTSQSGVQDSLTIYTGTNAPPGTYNFVVSAVSPSGATGSGIYGLTVTGYTVTFNETGLPQGTMWSVSLQTINNGVLTGYTTSSSTTNQVVFENQAGGTVGWNVSSSISGASPGVRYVPALVSGTISIFSNTNLALGAYTTQYEVNFEVTPAGSGSTNPVEGVNWLNAGSAQIAATNSSGYTFSSWSANTSSITLNDASAKSTSAEVSGPGTITATFIPTVRIELNSTAAAVRQGNNVSSGFLVLGGPQSVTLSNSSLPAGASLSWQEKSITDSTTGTLDSFVIQTSVATPTGTHIVTLTATGADGQKDEVNYTLVVLSPTATTAALPASTGNGDVTFSTSAGAFLNISSISTSSLGQKDKPSTVSFPYGMFSWTVNGLTKGQTISVSITLPTELKPDTQYWKYNGTQWINATSLITAEEGNTTTLTITDGGTGDLDGVANGQITDPGGVGFAANVVTSTIPATIPGGQANGVIYDSDNGLLYLTEIRAPYDDLNVSVINPETDSIVASIPVPGAFSSGAMAFDPSNGFLYVPESDGTVTVIDGATNSVVNTITFPTGNNLDDGLGIVYDSGNGILYVSGASSAVYAIDPSAGVILGQILLPNGGGLGQLAYDPSNGLLYQTVTLSATQSAVDVLNPSSGGVVSIIPLNRSAGPIVYDSTNGAIYVTDQSNVSEIDTSSNLISSSIVVPAYGGNLQNGFASFDPNTNTLYISDDSYNVFAIDPTTNSIIAQVSFPEATTTVSGIAVDTNNCNLYAVIGTGSPFSGYLAVIPTGCASGTPLPSSAPASPNSASSTVPVGSGPIAEALDTSNDELFVGNAGSDSVTVMNAGTGSVISTISLVFPSYYTEITPTSLTFDPANGYIYITSFSSSPYSTSDGSYAVINGATNSIVTFSGGDPSIAVEANTYPRGSVYVPTNQEVLMTSDDEATGMVQLIVSASYGDSGGYAPVAYNPYGIVYDSANGYLYVANSELSGSVSVLSDCEPVYYSPTCNLVATIPVGSAPTGEVFDPSNGYIYVADSASNAVSVINGATNTVVANIGVGDYPIGLAYDSSASEVLVTNELSGTVSVINTGSNSVVATVPIGPHPDGILYDATNCNAYVTNNVQDGTLSVISTNCEPISSQFEVTFQSNPSGVNPAVSYTLSNSTSGSGTTPLTINIDSTSGSTPTVSPKPISSGTVLSTIPGELGSSTVFDPNNDNLYTNAGNGYSDYYVSVINARSNSPVTTIYTGGTGSSSSLVYDPANGYIYQIINFGAGSNSSIDVINPNTNSVMTSITVGVSARGLVYDPANGNLYSAAACTTTIEPPYPCSGYLLYTISGTTNTVTSTVEHPITLPPGEIEEGYQIVYNPTNGEIYILSDLDSVSVFNPATGNFVADFSGDGTCCNYLTNANGEIFVSNVNENSVTIIDSSNVVVATIATGTYPSSAVAPVFDPLNGNLYVFSELSNTQGEISVINTTTNSLVDTIPITGNVLYSGSTTPIFDPANSAIYVPDESDGSVAVINASTDSVMPSITTIEGTDTIALDPLTGDLYASTNAPVLVVLGVPFVVTPTTTPPITISYTYQEVVPGASGVQYLLTSVTPSSPQTLTNSLVITGTYVTQYQVTFAQTGLNSSATGTILNVAGLNYTFSALPFSEFVNSSSTLNFAYTASVPSSDGGTFLLTGVSGNTTDSTVSVDNPLTVTGAYSPEQSTTTTVTTTTTTTSNTTTTFSTTTISTTETTTTATETTTSLATSTSTTSSVASTSTTTIPTTVTSGVCTDPEETTTTTFTTTVVSTITTTTTVSYVSTVTGSTTTTVETIVTTTMVTTVPITTTQTLYSSTTVCSTTVSSSSTSIPSGVPEFPFGIFFVLMLLAPLVVLGRRRFDSHSRKQVVQV